MGSGQRTFLRLYAWTIRRAAPIVLALGLFGFVVNLALNVQVLVSQSFVGQGSAGNWVSLVFPVTTLTTPIACWAVIVLADELLGLPSRPSSSSAIARASQLLFGVSLIATIMIAVCVTSVIAVGLVAARNIRFVSAWDIVSYAGGIANGFLTVKQYADAAFWAVFALGLVARGEALLANRRDQAEDQRNAPENETA